MSGGIHLLLLYAFMVQTRTTLPLIVDVNLHDDSLLLVYDAASLGDCP
jgi:hypothetical protein